MSIKALEWALHQVTGLHPTRKLVLIALANEAATDGRGAFLSAKTIAEIVGISHRAAQGHMKALEDDGLLSRGDQRRAHYIDPQYRPVVYDLNLENTDRLNALMDTRPKRAKRGGRDFLKAVDNPPNQIRDGVRTQNQLRDGLRTQIRDGVRTQIRNPERPDTQSDTQPIAYDPLTQKDNPASAHAAGFTSEVATCTSCDRERWADELTSSGLCTDCLPHVAPREPDPAEGTGRAAVLDLLAERRAKKSPAPSGSLLTEERI